MKAHVIRRIKGALMGVVAWQGRGLELGVVAAVATPKALKQEQGQQFTIEVLGGASLQ